MDSESTLRFRWNDHVLHLSKAFSEQRVEEQYCNVSLVSEDGYIIKAHSIILCMTSVYFEHILQNVTPDQHPIIVLHGVNYSELSCIIDYIYFGITRVDEHLMESVLDLADMLEIKGLSKMKNNISVKKLIAPSNPHSISAHTQSNPKTNTSISSFSEDSNKCTMKVDSDHNERINIEKDRKEYETSQERNNSCMRDLTKRLNQSNENLDDSQKSENVDLDEETENSMDQTLGIDLSLSKSGSSVLLNKDFGKNFNLHEDDLGKKNNGDENFASSKQKTVVKSLGGNEEHFSYEARSVSSQLFLPSNNKMDGRLKSMNVTESTKETKDKGLDCLSMVGNDSGSLFMTKSYTQECASKSISSSNRLNTLLSLFDDEENIPDMCNQIMINKNASNGAIIQSERENDISDCSLANEEMTFDVDNNSIQPSFQLSNRLDDKRLSTSPSYRMIRSVLFDDECYTLGGWKNEYKSKNVGKDSAISLIQLNNANYSAGNECSATVSSSAKSICNNTNRRLPCDKPLRFIPVSFTSTTSTDSETYYEGSSIKKGSYDLISTSIPPNACSANLVKSVSLDQANTLTDPYYSELIPLTLATEIRSGLCASSPTLRKKPDVEESNSIEKTSVALTLPTSLPDMIQVNAAKPQNSFVHPCSDKVTEIFNVMDCRKPKSQVKRPPNKYTLYVKAMLPTLSLQYPRHTNQQKISLISQMWNKLSAGEKQIWVEKAKEVKMDFIEKNPHYVFNPFSNRIQKEDYKLKKYAKDFLFLPTSKGTKFKNNFSDM